jgi:hypothetical protein
MRGAGVAPRRARRVRLLRIGLFLFAMASSAQKGSGQLVRGRLLDISTRAPINTALVALLDTALVPRASAVTDDSGRFVLQASRSGTYRIRAERIGYRAALSDVIELLQGPTRYVEFRLSAEAVLLEPLRVVAAPRVPALDQVGFYSRRQAGPGIFITRDDFEYRQPRFPSEVLRGAPGVIVRGTARGNVVSFMRSGGTSFRGCSPQLWLDGMHLPDGGAIDVVSIHDLEAIEAYRGGSQIPAQYSGAQSACGVILLWTRRGIRR